MSHHICPECHCSFMQEFLCTTCGAQKLHDCTTATLERDNATLKLALTDQREALAAAIIDYGFATGHGDTHADLLSELEGQVWELRRDAARYRWLRERPAWETEAFLGGLGPKQFDAAVDARSKK